MSHSDSTAPQKTSDKLILYLIGHDPDAHYLERLLAQVKPIVRFVSFVAAGEGVKCNEVLKRSGIAHKIAHYNVNKREDFNFSDARNLALQGCNAYDDEWLFWLDCDDSIEQPERILAQMRKHAGADAYGLPYDVSACQSNLFKIRIHKHDWHWRNKVHEELVCSDPNKKPNITVISDCPVKHAPDKGKSNHDFHIELLTKACQNSPNEYAYIAKEHFNMGRWEQALEWFKKVIAVHPIEQEVFNAHLHVGLCEYKLGQHDNALESLYEAVKVRPYRREPYFFLAEIMATLGSDWHKRGLGLISACNAQSDFREPGQNAAIYDCVGYKLHARYLMRDKRWQLAHQVMQRAKTLDDEAQQIILEIEAAMKDAAIEQRDKD